MALFLPTSGIPSHPKAAPSALRMSFKEPVFASNGYPAPLIPAWMMTLHLAGHRNNTQ